MSFVDDFSNDRTAKFNWNGHVGTAVYGSDNLVVMFYMRSTHSPQQSTAAGHPVYTDILYVRYHPPGERLNINDRPAREGDKRRWALQWSQFEKQLVQRPDGMPVGQLYPHKPAIAATLQACGVFTVEQLANLSAHAIEQVGMGAQSWVNDAQKYLEAANKGVKASQLAKELESRDGEIRVLNQKLDRALAEIERLRDGGGGATDKDQMAAMMQQMLANMMGQRPQFPGNAPGAVFDAQTAQINATREQTVPAPRRARQKKGT